MRRLQQWSAGLAVSGMVAAQAHAVVTTGGTDTKSVIAACAAERAPLEARKKEYDELKRARLGQSIAAGAKAGAGVLMTGALAGMTGGGSLMAGGMAGGMGARMGGIPGMAGMMPGGAGAALRGAPAGFSDPGGMFSQALGMKIPGVTSGGAGYGGAGGSDYTKALIAVSLVTAVAGTIDAYMKLKQEQYQNDTRALALSIDGDAGSQTPVAVEMTSQVGALADCRQRQVTELSVQLSSAGNDKDRKKIGKGKSSLQTALKTDLDLSDGLVVQQANLTKTFTQGRAMAEGKSEAEVLGGQQAAYGEASTIPMKLGAAPAPSANAPPPPPPQATAMVTTRAAVVRSAPSTTASAIMNFPAGRAVTPKGRAPSDASWWEIDLGGSPGYMRAADLGEGSAKVASAKGKPGAKPSGPPALAPPNNIRSLNKQVLAAKTQGIDRLKTLSTDVQMGRLDRYLLWAKLASRRTAG